MSRIDPDQFRKEFPEFSNTDRFTNAMIDMWSGIADSMLNVNRWGDLLETGIKLFVAHNIAVQAQNVAMSVVPGGVPGQGAGLMSNQGAGSVSVGIDTQATILDQGGKYNLTHYGVQFLKIGRILSAGGLQL